MNLRGKIHRGPVLGLGLIVLFAAIELAMHSSRLAQRLRAETYVALNAAVRAFVYGIDRDIPPITLIDISAIKMVEDKAVHESFTPPAALLRLLKQVAEKRPRNIGVDVDLSPIVLRSGPYNPEQVFDLMLEAEGMAKDGIPVYFGVFRGIDLGPERWLRSPDWHSMAVWIGLPRGREFMTPVRIEDKRWTRDGQPVVLPSMAAALAGRAAERREGWMSVTEEQELLGNTGAQLFLSAIDLSWISVLRATVVPCKPDGSLPDLFRRHDLFHDRVVLIGDVQAGLDKVQPPGFNRPIPGVLVHAAGVATLLESPLAVLKHSLGFALGVGVMLIGWIWHAIRHRAHPKASAGEAVRFTLLFSCGWALVATAIATILAINHILWLELVLVLMFLIAHTLCECAVATMGASSAKSHARSKAV